MGVGARIPAGVGARTFPCAHELQLLVCEDACCGAAARVILFCFEPGSLATEARLALTVLPPRFSTRAIRATTLRAWFLWAKGVGEHSRVPEHSHPSHGGGFALGLFGPRLAQGGITQGRLAARVLIRAIASSVWVVGRGRSMPGHLSGSGGPWSWFTSKWVGHGRGWGRHVGAQIALGGGGGQCQHNGGKDARD